jgi:hypothetical protein
MVKCIAEGNKTRWASIKSFAVTKNCIGSICGLGSFLQEIVWSGAVEIASVGSLWLYHLVDVVTWDVGSRAESENISGSAVVLESSPQLSKALVVGSMTSDRLVLGSVILMERLFLELATCVARLANSIAVGFKYRMED